VKVYILTTIAHEYAENDAEAFLSESGAHKRAAEYMRNMLKDEFEHYLRTDWVESNPNAGVWYHECMNALSQERFDDAIAHFNNTEFNEKFEIVLQEKEALP
jgi:hypothetical protein